ncbi:MAG: ABC transporter ATP-binding protein [Treponemataceae bacterium]
MKQKSFIELHHLDVGYDKKIIVSDINININRGEIISLIGPNGSGKSTILKTIIRNIKSLGGEIFVDGKNLKSIPNNVLAKKISILLTSKIKTDLMSCYDVVATGRYPYTGRLGILSETDKEKINEAMGLVGISELKNFDFLKISDGQRQRVMLARAICQETEIIILDEPMSFLDIKYKIEFLSLLNDLAKKKNITIIMSIHELDLAERISDKVLSIKDGKVFSFSETKKSFTEKTINELYDLKNGNYNHLFGSLEIKNQNSDASVFVLAGNGSGCDTFRFLNKYNISFYTGIIFKNDIDFILGNMISKKIIYTNEFETISEEKINEAKNLLNECKTLIICNNNFNGINSKNYELINFANKKNIKIVDAQKILHGKEKIF